MKLSCSIDDSGKWLGFRNFERADERGIFDTAASKLQHADGVVLGSLREAPYMDYRDGTLSGVAFRLRLDDDEGATITSDSPAVLQTLKQMLET